MPKRSTRRRRPKRTLWTSNYYQLQRDVKNLKNFINVEFKYKDTELSVNPSASGAFYLLNGLQTGDNVINRDGRLVRIKSCQAKYKLTMNASATNTTVRFLWFIDKQANQSTPTGSDLFINVNTQGLKNLNNRKRFVFLKDQTISLSSNSLTEKRFNYYRKLDMKTVYDAGDAGTIADITTNALYLYVISDEAVNTPSLELYNRIRFIDN